MGPTLPLPALLPDLDWRPLPGKEQAGLHLVLSNPADILLGLRARGAWPPDDFVFVFVFVLLLVFVFVFVWPPDDMRRRRAV